MVDYYAILGVDKKADKKAIGRAYRKKAQSLHPDKGGTAEEFHQLQLAYQVLSDDKRRSAYDLTGVVPLEQSPNQRVVQEIAAMMILLMDQVDVRFTDLVGEMIKGIETTLAQTEEQIQQEFERISTRKMVSTRIRRRGRAQNVLLEIVNGDIQEIQKRIDALTENQRLGQAMLKMLMQYEYDADKMTMRTAFGA